MAAASNPFDKCQMDTILTSAAILAATFHEQIVPAFVALGWRLVEAGALPPQTQEDDADA